MEDTIVHPDYYFILLEFSFIKIVFFPPNTTPILLMDQQVISNIKKLYSKGLFKFCFDIYLQDNIRIRQQLLELQIYLVILLRLTSMANSLMPSQIILANTKKIYTGNDTVDSSFAIVLLEAEGFQ